MIIKHSNGDARELVLTKMEWAFFRELVSLRVTELETLQEDLAREVSTPIGVAVNNSLKDSKAIKELFENSDTGETEIRGWPLGDQ